MGGALCQGVEYLNLHVTGIQVGALWLVTWKLCNLQLSGIQVGALWLVTWKLCNLQVTGIQVGALWLVTWKLCNFTGHWYTSWSTLAGHMEAL